jgi:hypothetical protein
MNPAITHYHEQSSNEWTLYRFLGSESEAKISRHFRQGGCPMDAFFDFVGSWGFIVMLGSLGGPPVGLSPITIGSSMVWLLGQFRPGAEP